nr:sugar transferase [Planosporangium mesophilum]
MGSVEYLAVPSSDTRTRVRTAHSVFQRYRCRTLPKWTLDLLGASVGLVLTLPLWPVIALLIWFEEPGPVFRVEYVVGKRGVTFRRYGFRTTRRGAERRTLTVGRFLRRWHLDALPALANVLIGQMSLVGPVPQRTVLVWAHLGEVPGYSERHTVKPGMVGTVPPYDDPTPMERLDADRAYLRRMSFLLDLWLLVRAAAATLRGRRRPAPAASPQATGGRVVPTKRSAVPPVPVRREAWPVRYERSTRPGGRRTTSTVYRSATFSHALPTNRRD